MKKTLCAILVAGATCLSSLCLAEDAKPAVPDAAKPAAAKPAAPAKVVSPSKGDGSKKKELTPEEKAALEKRMEEAKARREARQKQMEQNVLKRMQRTASELLAMYDKNQNGKLDPEERAQMEKDIEMAKKMQHILPLKEILDDLDADHDLQISDEEGAKIGEVMRRNRPRNSGNRPAHGGKGPQKGGPNMKNRPVRPPMPDIKHMQRPDGAPKPVSQATPKKD